MNRCMSNRIQKSSWTRGKSTLPLLRFQSNLGSLSAKRKLRPCCFQPNRQTIKTKASAEDTDSFPSPEEDETQNESSRTLPSLKRTPEQTFVLAGLLKIFVLATTYPRKLIFKPLGKTPYRFTAYLLLVPFGIMLSYLSGFIVKSKFMRRRGSVFVIILAAALMLTGFDKLYDVRPAKPRVSKPVESHWSDDLFRNSQKRTGEDTERIWEGMEQERLEKEGVV